MMPPTKPLLLVLTALLHLLAACQGDMGTPAPGPSPDPDPWPDPPPTYQDGGAPLADAYLPPATDSYVPPPTADTGVPAASNCPDLTGQWSGTLNGSVTLLLQFQVSGTLGMTLSPAAQAGNYTITNGQMVATPDGISGADFTSTITGEVKCGVLDIVSQADIYGVPSVGTVKCTFDKAGTGCTGTWTGNSTDGKATGSGSFTLKRK